MFRAIFILCDQWVTIDITIVLFYATNLCFLSAISFSHLFSRQIFGKISFEKKIIAEGGESVKRKPLTRWRRARYRWVTSRHLLMKRIVCLTYIPARASINSHVRYTHTESTHVRIRRCKRKGGHGYQRATDPRTIHISVS